MSTPGPHKRPSKILGHVIFDPDGQVIWRIAASAANGLRHGELAIPQWALQFVRLGTVIGYGALVANDHPTQSLVVEGTILRLDADGFWDTQDRQRLEESAMRAAFSRPPTPLNLSVESTEAKFARRRIEGAQFKIEPDEGALWVRLRDHFVFKSRDPQIKRGLILTERPSGG